MRTFVVGVEEGNVGIARVSTVFHNLRHGHDKDIR